jgi:ribosomal-protein-alanine N-acetyltransferase
VSLDRRSLGHPSLPLVNDLRLYGRRVTLRSLTADDFDQFSDVRLRNESWLLPWEPRRGDQFGDPARHRDVFAARCQQRTRDRQNGTAYGFGLFVDQRFIGEVNINNVVRGAMQSGTIGYWIDRARAGQRYVAEGVTVLMRFGFEELRLHRLEICIVPRNDRSRRVMEVLGIREEGIAQRFLEIDGTWEDHVRYGITLEEWHGRRSELAAAWL